MLYDGFCVAQYICCSMYYTLCIKLMYYALYITYTYIHTPVTRIVHGGVGRGPWTDRGLEQQTGPFGGGGQAMCPRRQCTGLGYYIDTCLPTFTPNNICMLSDFAHWLLNVCAHGHQDTYILSRPHILCIGNYMVYAIVWNGSGYCVGIYMPGNDGRQHVCTVRMPTGSICRCLIDSHRCCRVCGWILYAGVPGACVLRPAACVYYVPGDYMPVDCVRSCNTGAGSLHIGQVASIGVWCRCIARPHIGCLGVVRMNVCMYV